MLSIIRHYRDSRHMDSFPVDFLHQTRTKQVVDVQQPDDLSFFDDKETGNLLEVHAGKGSMRQFVRVRDPRDCGS